MPHDDTLILTLVAGFVLAFVLGMLAQRRRCPEQFAVGSQRFR